MPNRLHPEWTIPALQKVGKGQDYWVSRSDHGELRIFVDGTVQVTRSVPLPVLLRTLAVASPATVFQARHNQRASWVRSMAKYIHSAWEEAVTLLMTQRQQAAAEAVRAGWIGSGAHAHEQQLERLASSIEKKGVRE